MAVSPTLISATGTSAGFMYPTAAVASWPCLSSDGLELCQMGKSYVE